MDLKQFTKDATRTESVIESVKVNPQLFASVLQIVIASGNMLDQIKKHAYYGKDYDTKKLVAEFMNIVVSLDELKQVTQTPADDEVELDIDTRITHSILGAATESVELVEALSSYVSGNPLDIVNVLEEFGDMLYYAAIGHDQASIDMETTLDTTINKLKHRYPDKFTQADALERDLSTEREILEKGLM